ncbi:hypothetical protein HPB52_013262 [Rhipicephalus sanguineus]|uniref:RING-type domain-containing protein n=1 Tax=Rhipicephalus sanguineus TaxID=34632 RepID=A0A9D4PFG1_RHISA|nr:hypothetical protein HPB52_013262 [Rhipicephalus sanguineus]
MEDSRSSRNCNEVVLDAPSMRDLEDVNTASVAEDNARRRGKRPLSSSRCVTQSPRRSSSSYLLRGFGSPFLDSVPVTFLRRLPSVCICAGCRSIHATPAQLPCGHTLCEPCRDVAYSCQPKRPALQDQETREGSRYGTCPVDGDPFSTLDFELLDFCRQAVYRGTVICPNAQFGCRFRGELRFLEYHCLSNCRFRITGSSGRREWHDRHIIRYVLRSAAESSRVPRREIRTAKRRLLSTFEL